MTKPGKQELDRSRIVIIVSIRKRPGPGWRTLVSQDIMRPELGWWIRRTGDSGYGQESVGLFCCRG